MPDWGFGVAQLRRLGLTLHNMLEAADILLESWNKAYYDNAREVDLPGVRKLLSNALHGRRPGTDFRLEGGDVWAPRDLPSAGKPKDENEKQLGKKTKTIASSPTPLPLYIYIFFLFFFLNCWQLVALCTPPNVLLHRSNCRCSGAKRARCEPHANRRSSCGSVWVQGRRCCSCHRCRSWPLCNRRADHRNGRCP